MRLKARLNHKTRLEIARYLVLRWAPGAELHVRENHSNSAHHITDPATPGPDEIVWAPCEGLTVLLHEIGHYRVGRRISGAMGEGKLGEVAEEALAWYWAEYAARVENLWFDYRAGDKWFRTYAKSIPLTVRWRYRDAYRDGGKEAE